MLIGAGVAGLSIYGHPIWLADTHVLTRADSAAATPRLLNGITIVPPRPHTCTLVGDGYRAAGIQATEASPANLVGASWHSPSHRPYLRRVPPEAGGARSGTQHGLD